MGARAVVVDDDSLVGELSKTLLEDAGYEVDLINDSAKGLQSILARPPALVLLDILMPGLDGLTLCHRIKSNAATKAVKVVMVSGKAFHADRKRAADYGADLFIEKPYNVDTFAMQIADLLAGQAPPPLDPAAAPRLGPQPQAPAEAKMHATVWGCRSLSPYEGGEPSRYGRHTPCVSLEVAGSLLIFDAGSGIVPLGQRLVEEGKYRNLWLLLTHFHQDHIEGLEKFAPAYAEGFKINIGAPASPDEALEGRIQNLFEAAPPEFGAMQAQLEIFEMREETYALLPGVQLSPFFANHPDTTLAFVVEAEGRKFVYAPDSEIYGEQGTAMQDYDERLCRLAQGADVLIHDARYLDSDYQTRKNNGHSSWADTVDLAARCGIRRLVLFHHDDSYSDALLDRTEADARKRIAEKGYALELMMAREGLKIGF